MRVVVTGANGLVGSRLAEHLLTLGHEPIGLGRGPRRPALSPAVAYRSVDLTHGPELHSALTELAPEAIVNCAAMTDVDGCERDPRGAWASNVDAVATMASWSRGKAFLLHVSTDYVFDGNAGPYDVDALPNPRGVYAQSKYAGELAVHALAAPGHWAIARTAVVYGLPSTGKNNFGSWLVDTLGAGKQVKLFSDQWVSPSHATNVAQMLAELAERRLAGLWHTSGADVVDRVTFGRRLCERFGFDPALIVPSRMSDVNLPSPRPAKSGLIVTKTSTTLTHRPAELDASLAALHSEHQRASMKGSTP